jgi:hypothetical protein
MKKYILIAAVAILSAFNLIGALAEPASANLGKLGCADLTDCASQLQCPGKGSPSGCNIACVGGGEIHCGTL